MITYRTGNALTISDVIDVYRDSTLGQHRPVDDVEAMTRMFSAANLVVSAWSDDRLVGVARSLSDFTFCTYLSDLAVRTSFQRSGIGKELIRKTQKEGKTATIFLFAADAAASYYPHIGFSKGSGWTLPRMSRVGSPTR